MVRVLKVPYAYFMRMMFYVNQSLTFYLSITIGSVVLSYFIYGGVIFTFAIDSISSVFKPLDVLVAARKAWRLVHLS